jgi:hypothetical protein
MALEENRTSDFDSPIFARFRQTGDSQSPGTSTSNSVAHKGLGMG